MFKKVQKQVQLCLTDDVNFSKLGKDSTGDKESEEDVEENDLDPEDSGESIDSMESGQSLSMYYWGLSKLGIPSNDPIFDLLD
jgi:hypothetical protein